MRLVKWGKVARRLHRRIFWYDNAVDFNDREARQVLVEWHCFHTDRRMPRRGEYFDAIEIDDLLEPFGMQIEGVERTEPVRAITHQVEVSSVIGSAYRNLCFYALYYVDFITFRNRTKHDHDRFDVFYMRRKPWKRVNDGLVRHFIETLGGEIV